MAEMKPVGILILMPMKMSLGLNIMVIHTLWITFLVRLNNLVPLQLMWQWKWTNQIFAVLDHYYIIMLRESYQEKACKLIFQFYMSQLPFRDFQLKDRKKYLPKATDKIYTFIFLIIIIILK